MAPSVRFVPRSLMTPGGAVFLDPAHRVSSEELYRRDARWRALRERAYARAWSDDATLVGSVHLYTVAAFREGSLRDFEGRNSGHRRRVSGNQSDEASTIRRQRSASLRRGESHHDGRLSRLLMATKRGRHFKSTLRRLVGRGRG
jgi:hypothetical protein